MERRSFLMRIVAAITAMFVARTAPVTYAAGAVGKCYVGDEKEPILLIFKWEISEASFRSIDASDLVWIDRKDAK